ncbi:longitudinals lacking protein, isoforms H/M/V-like isoform X2 [Homarus americanus]|uniref:longitudinals lacking protein, isoforms H/M/V-like isoform X2 n=1 Tax=Homarus americanus TaxID=6706 RepID=UPI001C47D8EC|nr:longitudinals lacking protein, isoforms H/M/V-like isoform X2 [Homarus americanus]
MEELLSLKWNNHRSTFLHILGVLRDKQAYTDVTLACDGKFYSVHKLVLSTCSDYFCAMFDKTACKSPVIVLKDIKSEDLEALLDYMYLGEVNVRQCDLASLIKAAENLRIKGLAVPDDEPLKKGAVTTPSRAEPTRRDGGSGSPPSKRKRRDEGEDGREDVRPPPPLQSGLHTPPPPPRPKSPVSQRLSPSPLRTSQESLVTEDRDSRPLSSPAESPVTSHVPSHQSSQQLTHQPSQPPLQSSQPLPEQQQTSNQYRGEDTPTFVKVEMEEEDTGDIHQDSYNLSGDGYKEEEGGDLGGDLSNDLPEFLQQAASGALAGTSASYHHAFAGPSGFQPEVSGWQGDSQSLPGSFAGLGFQPSTQDNPPGGPQGGGGDGSDGGGAAGRATVQCPVCGRQFHGTKRNYLLNRHFQIHTGEKPYQCPHCSHRANRKSNLKMHIESRHGSQVTFYSRAQTPELNISQDSTLGFLSESITGSQESSQEHNPNAYHKSAQTSKQEDSNRSHRLSKLTRDHDPGGRESRQRSGQKMDYCDAGVDQVQDAAHEHHQSTFSPFSDFLNVRQESVNRDQPGSVAGCEQTGYSHQQ